MAGKHPYISSGGPIVQAISQFRKSFPAKVDVSTLKKLGIAKNNESYLVNILRFMGLINEDGSKTDIATKVFSLPDSDFQTKLSEIVSSAYEDLFTLHQGEAWLLDDVSLITYFRQADDSSDIVGSRQANTFKVLAGLCGKRELRTPRQISPKKKTGEAAGKQINAKTGTTKPRNTRSDNNLQITEGLDKPEMDLALTVRIEINLPVDGSQDTYDRIFKSIKENLIDAYKS